MPAMIRAPNPNIMKNMHLGNLVNKHNNIAAITTVRLIMPAIMGIAGFKFSNLNPLASYAA